MIEKSDSTSRYCTLKYVEIYSGSFDYLVMQKAKQQPQNEVKACLIVCLDQNEAIRDFFLSFC